MPFLNSRSALEVARGIKVFLNLDAGATRGEIPASGVPGVSGQKVIEKNVREESYAVARTVDPAKVVWIFGMARTGSTWLGRMMGDMEAHRLFDEPRIGSLFGDFYYETAAHKVGKNSLLGFSDERRQKLIRSFTMLAIEDRFPGIFYEDYVVVKEPNGSVGAPLLVEALPESRMVFLLRDPRDVVSSSLSGKSEGGWMREKVESGKRKGVVREDPNQIVAITSKKYLRSISKAREAYDSHKGPRTLVTYEELRADTLGTMRKIYSDLGISADEAALSKVVEKHDWESIPEEKKGHGKRNRKATPGGWQEDLTPEQAKMVEEITAPIFGEFYA